jgi:hypothetical protein
MARVWRLEQLAEIWGRSCSTSSVRQPREEESDWTKPMLLLGKGTFEEADRPAVVIFGRERPELARID